MVSVVWRSNLPVPGDDLASRASGQGYGDIGLPLRHDFPLSVAGKSSSWSSC